MNRRTFFQGVLAGSAVGIAAVAGCTDAENDTDDGAGTESDDGNESDSDDAVPTFPRVENPPDAVYVPTHRESMRTLEPIQAGDYLLAPMLSYPHPFWIVTGRDAELVEPEAGPGVHLMFTLWNRETGTVLPVDPGTRIRIEKDGEEVYERRPWTMISQEMGFHFGDNAPLEGDGTYDVEVAIPPLDVPATGALEGKFADAETAAFEFVYDDAFREEVVGGVEYLDEEYWGEPGALEPMDHGDHGHEDHDGGGGDGDDGSHDDHDHDHDDADGDHHSVPYSAVPPADEFPGTVLGEPESGDAILLAAVVEDASRFVEDAAGDYLVVSPRTPYNRVPLADMRLRVAVTREGDPVDDADLEQTIDGELGLHYGAEVAGLEDGGTLEITVDAPPQVARHQGYETAFLEMPPVELSIDR